MGEGISAAEAASRLGVKRETLYAYVSRGVLTSRRRPEGRESEFDADEVERLAARSQLRRRSSAAGLSVESALTLVEPTGTLSYRGHDAETLVRNATFEEVALLLWTGEAQLAAPFAAPPELAGAALGALEAVGAGALPAERMLVALGVAGIADPLRSERDPESLVVLGQRILALEVAAAPAAPASLAAPAGRATASAATQRAGGAIAERLFHALARRRGGRAEIAALDAALVLLADDDLASSTVAARIAASTWASPYLVVVAGLTVASGPMHGSAGDRIAELLRLTARAGAEHVTGRRARRAEAGAGFGHPVYRDRDPRAEALWPYLEAAWPAAPVLAAADAVGALAAASFRNVDLALGALVAAAGMVPGAADAIFAVARSAGWLAHAGEEYGHGLRYRLRATYTGPPPQLSAAAASRSGTSGRGRARSAGRSRARP